jgi:mxaJ protein
VISPTTQPVPGVLRICTDPTLKSNAFEHEIAQLIAKELDLKLEYRHINQRMGFFRETLKAGECELVLSAPTEFEKALTTRPYFRSTYVFISRQDRNLSITSLDDPVLKKLKIALPFAAGATPPAQALAQRGIVDNLTGFSVLDADAEAKVIDAVASGEIDLAIMWGPQAAYFARQQSIPLQLTPLPSDPNIPFAFDISMAVKRGNKELRNKLDAAIAKHQKAIDKILDDHGVPRIE